MLAINLLAQVGLLANQKPNLCDARGPGDAARRRLDPVPESLPCTNSAGGRGEEDAQQGEDVQGTEGQPCLGILCLYIVFLSVKEWHRTDNIYQLQR